MKSLSPIQTDLPILPASPPPANPSPIVGPVLGFDLVAVAAPLQPCTHPRLEDTCSVDPQPDSEDHMVAELESQDLGISKDPMELEAALRDLSLDACKDVVLHMGSSDDEMMMEVMTIETVMERTTRVVLQQSNLLGH